MTDEENKQPAEPSKTDHKWQDQELRKTALEHARGAAHKTGSEIIRDAKAFYHFLTTKDPLVDEMPVKNNEPEPTGENGLLPGPIEHYSGISDHVERPPASDENATVSPPGVPVSDTPHSA